MKTRILQLIFLLILAFGLAPVSQAEGLKYKSTYDGTFLDTSFDINDDGFFTNVVRGSGKGTFGQSDSVIVTEFLPLGVTGECASDANLALLREFFEPRGEKYAASLEKATETIEDCIRKKAREGEGLRAFLGQP